MRQKDKKNDILDAATEIFCTKGFYSANIIDIANKAGIGKGTVYEYFDSKSSLFIEMIRFNSLRYKKQLKETISLHHSFVDKITAFIVCHNDIVLKNIKAAVMFFKLPADLAIKAENKQEVLDIFCETRHYVSDLLSDVLKQGMTENIITLDDMDFLSDIFLEMITRCSIRSAFMELSKKQTKNETDKLIALFLHGAGRRPPAGSDEPISNAKKETDHVISF